MARNISYGKCEAITKSISPLIAQLALSKTSMVSAHCSFCSSRLWLSSHVKAILVTATDSLYKSFKSEFRYV